MSDPTHKELKKEWQSYEEYEQWLKDNTYEKAKQSPNQTATNKTDKETREQDTTVLLNPMSGYDQNHQPLRIS